MGAAQRQAETRLARGSVPLAEARPLVREAGPGAPLEAATRAQFEPRFGHDLSRVRIHAGRAAARSAEALDAEAYTFGRDIYFGPDRYQPQTPPGRALIAHELAHVVQQEGRAPVVQRKKKKDKYAYPSAKSLEYNKIGESFTLLSPKKLKSNGPFTLALLTNISDTFTENSARRDPSSAHMILKALESSKTYVKIAKKLDKHYRKKSTPGFRVGFYGGGSKFTELGDKKGQGSAEDRDTINIDSDTVNFDPKLAGINGSPEYQAMTYVRIIVHETAHAYRHIKGWHKSGLKGQLEDEAKTRELEAKILAQIEKGLTKSGEKKQLSELQYQIKQVGSMKKKDIAHNLVSGSRLTYLENYYFNQALGKIRPLLMNRKVRGLVSGLSDPKRADDMNASAFRKGLDERYKAVRALIKKHTPSTAKTPASQPAGKTPAKPPPTPFGFDAQSIYKELLDDHWTLKEIEEGIADEASLLTDPEKGVLYYLALMKIYDLKQGITGEREKTNLKSGDAKYQALIDRIASHYLGRPKAYKKY